MHKRQPSPWTEAKDNLLRDIVVLQGQSYATAAAVLGTTRNAAIGRGHRLGLIGKAPRVKQPRVRKKAAPRPRIARRPRTVPNVPDSAVRWKTYSKPDQSTPEPTSLRLTLMDRKPHQCAWPSGDGKEITFCGRPTVEAPGASNHQYCEHHRGRKYGIRKPRITAPRPHRTGTF